MEKLKNKLEKLDTYIEEVSLKMRDEFFEDIENNEFTTDEFMDALGELQERIHNSLGYHIGIKALDMSKDYID